MIYYFCGLCIAWAKLFLYEVLGVVERDGSGLSGRDTEKNLPLDDFSYKIVLNAACSPEKVPKELKPLYGYLNDPRQSQVSPLTRRIDARVKKFNTDEWRRKYMTFEYMLKERERKGLEQGRNEGAAQERREIAKAMKKKNMDLSVIQELTALPIEEIEKL